MKDYGDLDKSDKRYCFSILWFIQDLLQKTRKRHKTWGYSKSCRPDFGWE